MYRAFLLLTALGQINNSNKKEQIMRRRDFILTSGTAAAALSFSGDFLRGSEKKRRILYFDLSVEWEHPPTVNEADGTSYSAKIVKQLGEKLGCEVIVTKDGSLFDGDLNAYDAFVFYTCGDLDKAPVGKKGMSLSGLANLLKAIRAGKGFFGIHSATDTWQCKGPLWKNQDPKDRTEYIKMIGGDFITHGEIQEADLVVTEPVELPCLKKSGSKKIHFRDEWYTMKNFNKDMHVLLVQETAGMKKKGRNACYNRPNFPATWIRQEGKGRVAYTSFGHGNEMWAAEIVQNVVYDLISFVLGDYPMDMTPNFDKVCPQGEVLPKFPEK